MTHDDSPGFRVIPDFRLETSGSSTSSVNGTTATCELPNRPWARFESPPAGGAGDRDSILTWTQPSSTGPASESRCRFSCCRDCSKYTLSVARRAHPHCCGFYPREQRLKRDIIENAMNRWEGVLQLAFLEQIQGLILCVSAVRDQIPRKNFSFEIEIRYAGVK